MATNYSPKIVTDGLVLCLDAANSKSYPGSGTTWTDLSGSGNPGTLVNGVGYSGGNLGSLTFDGTNDYVNCQNLDIWNSFGSSLTIDLTAKFVTASDSYGRLISKLHTGTSTVYSCFQVTTSTLAGDSTLNNIRWSINGTESNTADNGVSVYYNEIYNIICTYDGSQSKMYLNGNLIFSINVSGNIRTSSYPLTIGAGYLNSADQFFTGNIYSTKIYNRALTTDEVAQNFAALRGRFGI